MIGVELRAAHANGTYRWFEVVGGEAFDTVAGGYVFDCREITDRRISEEKAKRRADFDEFSFELSQKALDLVRPVSWWRSTTCSAASGACSR